jgi:hypothetical protein
MFALAVTMLLSDKVLGSDNWLAAAPDPRPDQMPTPVRYFNASSCCLRQLLSMHRRLVSMTILQTYYPSSRTTYVGILMNKRAVLCKIPHALIAALR